MENSRDMLLSTPPILSPATAKMLLEGKTRISLDLGLTETTVTRTDGGFLLSEDEDIGNDVLEKIACREDSAYFVDHGAVFQVALAGRHFYKLVPTERAPTLEIDGIRMHRTSGTTPDRDTEAKLTSLGLDHGNVLDTCTGLGYTASESVRRGAELVVTVELEPSVLRIALMNPWSKPLFSDDRIHKILGDSYMVTDALPDASFDFIIHDPPRHGQAGHLYGLDFYTKLYRLLRPGGRLFHYVGAPRSLSRGVNLHRGVARRLSQAGFLELNYFEEVLGLTCAKPTKP